MNHMESATPESGNDTLLDRLVGMPENLQRLTLILAALRLPADKRDKLILEIAQNIRDRAHALERHTEAFASEIAQLADLMQDRHNESADATEAERRLQESCDEGLAFLLRASPGLHRAMRSESRELTCTACGAMHETGLFLRALRRDLALSENDTERHDTLRSFADHVHRQTEELADLIEEYQTAAKGIGEDYPNWPFLMFRRDNLPADYRRQAESIGLGDTCAVNPSPRVNWNLLQRYLFTIFWEWQDAKRFLAYGPAKGDNRTQAERLKVCLADYPLRPESSITDLETEIFLKSFELPALTRARESRRQWAECFIVPLIDLREDDLEAVPAFTTWLEGGNLKVRDRKGMLAAIKEGVIRALEAMAREDLR